MDQFVCVRLIKANGLDLATFQFDYDLTFAVFFLHPDKTIYGRFGTRSELEDADCGITVEGLRAAMEGALALHRQYPKNRSLLAGKTGPEPRFATPEQYPALRDKYTSELDYAGNVVRSCVHCHQVHEAERSVYRSAGQRLPDPVLFPYPTPEVIGLELDPKSRARIQQVTPDSIAARAGLRPNDELLLLEEQPILSVADVQWVLHHADPEEELQAVIRRDGQRLPLVLQLDAGWRQRTDISWRPTTWDLRRIATGGLVLEHLPADRRESLRVKPDQLALHVKYVGQYGEHAAAKNAGFQKGDVIIEFAGHRHPMRETDLIALVLKNYQRGSRIPVKVLREGKTVELMLPVQ